jgi:hypothetical protein
MAQGSLGNTCCIQQSHVVAQDDKLRRWVHPSLRMYQYRLKISPAQPHSRAVQDPRKAQHGNAEGWDHNMELGLDQEQPKTILEGRLVKLEALEVECWRYLNSKPAMVQAGTYPQLTECTTIMCAVCSVRIV